MSVDTLESMYIGQVLSSFEKTRCLLLPDAVDSEKLVASCAPGSQRLAWCPVRILSLYWGRSARVELQHSASGSQK